MRGRSALGPTSERTEVEPDGKRRDVELFPVLERVAYSTKPPTQRVVSRTGLLTYRAGLAAAAVDTHGNALKHHAVYVGEDACHPQAEPGEQRGSRNDMQGE